MTLSVLYEKSYLEVSRSRKCSCAGGCLGARFSNLFTQRTFKVLISKKAFWANTSLILNCYLSFASYTISSLQQPYNNMNLLMQTGGRSWGIYHREVWRGGKWCHSSLKEGLAMEYRSVWWKHSNGDASTTTYEHDNEMFIKKYSQGSMSKGWCWVLLQRTHWRPSQ